MMTDHPSYLCSHYLELTIGLTRKITMTAILHTPPVGMWWYICSVRLHNYCPVVQLGSWMRNGTSHYTSGHDKRIYAKHFAPGYLTAAPFHSAAELQADLMIYNIAQVQKSTFPIDRKRNRSSAIYRGFSNLKGAGSTEENKTFRRLVTLLNALQSLSGCQFLWINSFCVILATQLPNHAALVVSGCLTGQQCTASSTTEQLVTQTGCPVMQSASSCISGQVEY